MGVLARVRPRPVRKADQTPSVALVVSAHDEEAVIRRRVENALALDYPAESLEIVVASDGSTDLTDAIVGEIAAENSRVSPPAVPARGEGRGAASLGPRDLERRARVHRREQRVEARRAARARPQPGRPRGRVRLRAAPAREPGRREHGGRVLALRDVGARAGVDRELDHRRERGDLRGEARRVRRGRPEVRARLRLPVPDGADGAARRLRARGDRGREAGRRARGRVRPQGADDLARARPHPHGARLPTDAPAVPGAARLAPRAALLDGDPPRRAARRRTWCSWRARRSTASSSCSSSPGSGSPEPARRACPIPARGSPTTTTS